MSNPNHLYDSFAPLFGLANDDRRIRLYLDALKDEFQKTGFLKFTSDTKQLQRRNFTDCNDINDTNVHQEWHDLAADINAKSLLPRTADDIKVIHLLAGISSDTITNFLKHVVQQHFDLLTSTNHNITFLPARWNEVEQVNSSARANNVWNTLLNPSSGTPNTLAKKFTYKITKFVLLQLIEPPNPPTTDNFWLNDETPTNEYFRKVGNHNSLYTYENNNDVDVSAGSNKYLELQNDKCAGTKVKENGSLTCNEYLSKCIAGKAGDIANCKDYMLNPDFWNIVQREVNEMIPHMVTSTLNSFGFKIVNKNNLSEYEHVGQWSKSLENKGLNPAELNSIRTNTKLIQYLTMLVNKVNSNPAILNKNHVVKYVDDFDNQRKRFENWSLSRYGLNPRILLSNSNNGSNTINVINISRHINSLNNSLLDLRTSVNGKISFAQGSGLRINGVLMPIVNGLLGFQNGGGSVKLLPNTINVTNDELIKLNYPVMKSLFIAMKNGLTSKGKSFSPDTEQQIDAHLEQFKKLEEKLVKAIRYSDRYLDILNIYKDYDSENILNVDHLKSFVTKREHYFDKSIGKQNTILGAIEQIANSVSDALDNEETP